MPAGLRREASINGKPRISPTIRRSKFQASTPNPSGRGIVCRRIATFYIARNTPCAGGPGGEEYDVAWAELAFFAFLIRDEGLARNDDKSLVLVVIPVEVAGSAIPDHNVRGTVMASRQFLAPRLRHAVENPVGCHRGGLKVGGGGGGDHIRRVHCHSPSLVA